MDLNKKKFTKIEVDAYAKELKNEFEKAAMKQKERIFELKSDVAEMEKQLEEYRKREAQISKALTFAVQKAADIEDAAKRKYSTEIEHLRIFHEKWRAYYNQLITQYPIDENIKEIQEFTRQMNKIFSGGINNNSKNEGTVTNETGDVYEREKRRVNSSEAVVQKVTDVLKTVEPQERFERIVKSAIRKKPVKPRDEFAYYRQPEAEEQKFAPPTNIINYLEKEDEAYQNTVSRNIIDKRVGVNAIGSKIINAPIPPSDSGFSLEEALNPTQDLEDIMKDLGLIFDGDLEK